jgi:hypothetical protein
VKNIAKCLATAILTMSTPNLHTSCDDIGTFKNRRAAESTGPLNKSLEHAM